MEIKTAILIAAIPTISAAIGWATNYIAIKSLFKPVKPINILGLKLHGLIPKRQKALANNISEVVEKYLFSHTDILEELNKPSNIKKIKNKILPIIEQKILEKVPSMFRSVAEPIIKKILESEIDDIIHKINNEIKDHLFENVNIKQIIKEKLENYDTDNLEEIINTIAKKELKHIEYLGGVIGFIVGLVQLLIMLLLI